MEVGSTNRTSAAGTSSVAAGAASAGLAFPDPGAVALIHAPAAITPVMSACPAVLFE